MSQQLKISLAIVAVFVVLAATLLFLSSRDSSPAASSEGQTDAPVVRSDSRIIGEAGDSEVEFVEFLDFECEACRAAYPMVEHLRKEYEGKVTFVARYFPLPGHFNAERSARAVEAAAQQGEFETMYHKMFETQDQWGEQQEPMDELFTSFAEEIGLDMKQYRDDYENPATAQRVQRDVDDGVALGVQGTPTFFLAGERLEPRTYADLTSAIDDALAQ